MIKSTIICDSKSDTGRITTFELEYHRFFHSELMTHRVFSRNAMSSRAVPISKMIEQVRNNPAMPVKWGLNKAGMQSEDNHSDDSICIDAWKRAANDAAQSAERLRDLGLHKQLVNRVLEPFQMMKTVVTSTEWDNFFELRTHKDTQPEFQVLAKMMQEQYNSSEPTVLKEGQWHLPYVATTFDYTTGEQVYYTEGGHSGLLSLEEALKVSASCCAQVSYRVNDNSIDKALMIYDKLISSTPAHASPFEHQARVFGDDGGLEGVTHFDMNGEGWSGNFKNWIQYRQLL